MDDSLCNTRKSSYFGEFSYEEHVASIANLTRLSYLAYVYQNNVCVTLFMRPCCKSGAHADCMQQIDAPATITNHYQSPS